MPDVELALLIDRFMRRIHTSLQSKAPDFDTEKVGPGGGMVLLALADMGRAELHQLTARVARDKSQMTRLVQSLEKKGLIERRASDCDGRVSIISLTAQGKTVVDALRQALADTIDDILAPVTEDEKAMIKVLMRRAVG